MGMAITKKQAIELLEGDNPPEPFRLSIDVRDAVEALDRAGAFTDEATLAGASRLRAAPRGSSNEPPLRGERHPGWPRTEWVCAMMKSVRVSGEYVIIERPGDRDTYLTFDEVCGAAQALRAHLEASMPVEIPAPVTRQDLIDIADLPRTHDDDPAYVERAIDALIAVGLIRGMAKPGP